MDACTQIYVAHVHHRVARRDDECKHNQVGDSLLDLNSWTNWHWNYFAIFVWFCDWCLCARVRNKWKYLLWCGWWCRCIICTNWSTKTIQTVDKFFLLVWKKMRVGIQCCGYFFVSKSICDYQSVIALIDEQTGVCFTF